MPLFTNSRAEPFFDRPNVSSHSFGLLPVPDGIASFRLGSAPFCGYSIFHVLGDEVPVRQLPEGLDVLWPRVAPVDVVGVLPDIAGQQGLVLGRQRGAGVAGRPQFESS